MAFGRDVGTFASLASGQIFEVIVGRLCLSRSVSFIGICGHHILRTVEE